MQTVSAERINAENRFGQHQNGLQRRFMAQSVQMLRNKLSDGLRRARWMGRSEQLGGRLSVLRDLHKHVGSQGLVRDRLDVQIIHIRDVEE